MATSKTRTLLSLDRFFEIVQLHPLHANQVALSDAPGATCGQPLMQYSWQKADYMSREEIAIAIAAAESRIADYVGFDVLPRWNVDDRLQMNPTKFYTTPGGQPPAFPTFKGEVITGGIEAKTLISAGRPVAYSDPDGDGYNELATITAVTSVTAPEEIAVYYPNEAASDDWEIRPIKVAISAGIVTITCARHQLVAKNLLERIVGSDEIDGATAGNFLTTVDVYRHYNDPQQQIQFIWENGSCSCGSTDCFAATYTVQNGALFVRDYRRGLVAGVPANWNATDQAFNFASFTACRSPDKARVWYRAGLRYRGSYLRMHPEWERVVANFALCLMDRPICACSSVEHVTLRAKQDLALQTGSGDRFQVSKRSLDNPFGTQVGQMEAWKMCQQWQLGSAVDLHNG